jgi:hypothetical protein
MIRFGMFLSFIGVAIMTLGGFGCFALFLYGIYALFFKSVVGGLVAIGASCVATFLVRLVSGALMGGGAALAARSAEAEVLSEKPHVRIEPRL